MQPDINSIIVDTPRLLLRDDLCRAAADPAYTRGAPPVYIPASGYADAVRVLSDPDMAVAFDPERDAPKFFGIEARHGLLYLPFPYLVPGARYNSMFGWDTAFPVFAWADEHTEIMRWQVDNQLYQIRVYGKVLNANRTYYLSRSHPPLIAAMTLAVWRKTRDADWLTRTFRDLESYHQYWTTGDRLAGDGLLSRYWDDGDVPAPEAVVGEEGHFEHARRYFSAQGLSPDEQENRALFLDGKTGLMTALYYRADRAMRASGFDPTGHWDYAGLRCLFHAPVCLNALLYRMERDMAEIAAALGGDAAAWEKRAATRKSAMRKLMFDPATGLYHDYDFVRKRQNRKPFASIFHAFWAGLYDDDPEEARGAAGEALKHLEKPFGLSTSAETTGSQWDHPYGWPPMQYFAFAGLRRCGLEEDARRIAKKYVDLTARVFAQRGALFEKYNVVEGNADIRVVHGYHQNNTENGTFLWTAAVLKMAQDLLS